MSSSPSITVSNVPNPTEELPTGQLIQFVYYQAIALLLQPTRRFCFGITISNQPATRDDNAAPVADVVVVTRSHSLWCRITNLFEPSSGLPQLGALLVYLSRARPSCLGFIEGISPIASNTTYPVSDLLRVSSRSQDSAGHLGEVDLDFTKPLFVSKNPFSRFTAVTEVKSLKKPSLATDTQPTNNPPLVAKLAWLTNDHFLDGRPVEELVLEQVKTIDSRSRGSVAHVRACYVLGSIAGQDSAFARTPVLIIMEGKGATIRQRPFETVRDVFDYLEDSWRTMQDLWRIGVAHKDISTGNVLRQQGSSSVVVIDFGSSILFDPEGFPEGEPERASYRPLAGWKHREKHVTATPECAPVTVMRSFEYGWRRWSLRLEVETMMNLAARTLRLALDMGPLDGQQLLAGSTSSSTKRTPSRRRSPRSGTSALTASTAAVDNTMFWVVVNNNDLGSRTWRPLRNAKTRPHAAFKSLAEGMASLLSTHFLQEAQLDPVGALETEEGPDLTHRCFAVSELPQVVKEKFQVLSEARQTCQNEGTLDLPLTSINDAA